MASSNSKKILQLPANLAVPHDELCAAMAKKFVDAAGKPHFDFKVAEGHLVAEGEAWAKKASERPAWATMALFAEGYLACVTDNEPAIRQYNEPGPSENR